MQKNVKPSLFAIARISSFFTLLFILMATTAAVAANVTFRWDPTVSPHEGYRVFARKAGQAYNYSQPSWQGAATTCTIYNLQNQTEYYFVARAYNGSLESANSNEVHYVPPVAQNDDDGMPDDWEVRFGLDPRVDDADRDLDRDGISNRDEFRAGLEPDDRGVGASPLKPKPQFPTSHEQVERNPLLDAGDFSDADGDAHIATQWQVYQGGSTKCLLDVVTDRWLNLVRVPLLLLNGNGTYSWRARFFDSGGRASAWSARAYFTTQAVDGDLDGDGIRDDHQGGKVQAQVTRSFASPAIGCEPTDLAVASEETVAEIEQVALIDPNELEIDETTPAILPSALLAYKLVLRRPGQRALVTIGLSDPAPAGATWIKYDAVNGWQDYSHHAAISADRRSVTVEVKDGSFGDADGVANGIVLDPAGLSASATASTTAGGGGGGGGGGGCFLTSIHNAAEMEHGPLQRIHLKMRQLLTIIDKSEQANRHHSVLH